jgi:prepilin-type N-terminal cleavage/methylation domain-containing protein
MGLRTTLARAFTLIELLIVVAIIAILAAIAVPNFLEAQTRAKVSAGKAALRTMELGLESYAVDNNKYPYTEIIGTTPWLPPGGTPRSYPQAECGGLTSPIAYLSTLPNDSFKHDIGGVPVTAPVYYERAGFVFNISTGGQQPSNPPVNVPADAINTSKVDGIGTDVPAVTDTQTPMRYVLYSLGPDLSFNPPPPDTTHKSRFNLNNRYDPTNGSVSPGNIVRYPGSQMYPP